MILQDHDQSVDPNLVKLADAYDIASSKLAEASGPAAGAAEPAQQSAQPGKHAIFWCKVAAHAQILHSAA